MLSVIMPVRNAEATLPAQLEALSRQRLVADWELIVVDNGSTDASPAIAADWARRLPKLRVIEASVRPDPAAARNVGADRARGDLLLFCDADDIVRPGWAAAFAADCGNWDLAGGAIDYSALNAPGASPGRCVLPGPGQAGWLPFVATANLAVHRSAFEAIGGFTVGLEAASDLDFCWKAQLAGYRWGVVPGAVVAKRARTSTSDLYRRHVVFGRASVALYRRYRAHGMPRTSVPAALRTYAWLALRARDLREPGARREWARLAGVRWGRLAGSVRTGRLYL